MQQPAVLYTAILNPVAAAGRTTLMEKFTIAVVGHLIFFEDPGGNPIGATQYDSDAV